MEAIRASVSHFQEQLHHGFQDLPPNAVILNVYDISWVNGVLSPVGIGLHHSGIEVYGNEYAFGRCPSGTGVFNCNPKRCAPHIFKESYVLGWTLMSEAEVKTYVRSIAGDWPGNSYHICRKNCNRFSTFLAKELMTREGTGLTMPHNDRVPWAVTYQGPKDEEGVIPAFVNRLANTGVRWTPALCDKVDSFDNAHAM